MKDNKVREIEFRGKDINDNKWVYGFYSQFHNRPVVDEPNSHQIFEILPDEKSIRLFKTSIGGIWHIIDENTLGQFTGLCDKNGKKIYEGDIIKSHYGSIYIVKYFADWSGFSLKLVFLNTEGKLIRATGRQHLYKNDCTRLEILGNVWDNPELLGGRDEECDN